MTLIYLSCAWVAGILVGAKVSLPLPLILVGLAPLPLLRFRPSRKVAVLISLCLFAFLGGALRFQSSQPVLNQEHLAFYNDRGTVLVTGMVNTAPEIRDKTTHLYLSATAIKLDDTWREVSGMALLFVPRYSTYEYGDVLLVTGELKTPLALDDFDYPGYLAQQGIYSTMLYPKVEILERDRGFKPLAWVYSVRDKMSETLAQVLPEPQASIAQGMAVGIRANIPSPVKDNFSHTGTTHILGRSRC